MGAMVGGDSFGRDAKEALGTAAAFGSGIAKKRCDVALGLKTIKSGVNGADGNVALDAGFDFVANGDAVGFPKRRRARRTICSNSPRKSWE